MEARKKRNIGSRLFRTFCIFFLIEFLVQTLFSGIDFVSAQSEQAPPPASTSRDLARHVQGLQLYAKLCAECHGPDGQAPAEILGLLQPPPPDLRAKQYRYGSSEKEIAETIRRGRGVNMFRFDNRLSAEQIDALAKYVGTLRN